MARPAMTKITLAKQAAESGVDYSPKNGAPCPWCSSKAKIYKTAPWEDNIRIRYHRCIKPGCPLASLKVTIKSIQVDSVG